jgi:glycerol kinase
VWLRVGFLSGDRWHEHDADEIQQHADACIEGAIKELEKAGWAKESVKVIGAYSA